jgi:signal transduction histidine kinase
MSRIGEGPVAVRLAVPWGSKPAIGGALLGVAAALALSVAGAGGPAALTGLALPALGYLAGFAVACRSAFRDAAATQARLSRELRRTQDHLMENGSALSLPVYLEAAAPTLRQSLATLPQGDARQEALQPLAAYAPASAARAPFDLNNLLREAIDLCRHRAGEKRIRFEERYADIPPVFGPAGRVAAALLNVMVNAVEAMPFTGGTVSVATSHEGDRVVARVRDSGIGIRPEHLGRVFEPFFTTKPDRGSAGLGLWVVRDTLDRLGGSIQLSSVPHQGTEVVLSFPQAAPLHPGREGTLHPQELPTNTADRVQTA